MEQNAHKTRNKCTSYSYLHNVWQCHIKGGEYLDGNTFDKKSMILHIAISEWYVY